MCPNSYPGTMAEAQGLIYCKSSYLGIHLIFTAIAKTSGDYLLEHQVKNSGLSLIHRVIHRCEWKARRREQLST